MGNELLRAASCYLLASQVKEFVGPGEHIEGDPPDTWPYAPNLFRPDLADPVHCLVTARALITKEIERLQKQASG